MLCGCYFACDDPQPRPRAARGVVGIQDTQKNEAGVIQVIVSAGNHSLNIASVDLLTHMLYALLRLAGGRNRFCQFVAEFEIPLDVPHGMFAMRPEEKMHW